jgi:hypothetical protein
MPRGVPVEQHVLGLAPAAWLVLGGLGLVPFVLVLWSYTATFDPRDASADSDPDG